MFNLSAKADYGLTAIMDLASRDRRYPVQIRNLAEQHSIPQHYLEQLLVALKRKGIVQSYRGARGGYMLAAHPSEIRVLDVLDALDGPINLLPDKRKDSAIAFYMRDVEKELISALDISLEALLLLKQKSDEQFIYTI